MNFFYSFIGASLDDGPLDLSLESRARAKQDPNEFRPHDGKFI